MVGKLLGVGTCTECTTRTDRNCMYVGAVVRVVIIPHLIMVV